MECGVDLHVWCFVLSPPTNTTPMSHPLTPNVAIAPCHIKTPAQCQAVIKLGDLQSDLQHLLDIRTTLALRGYPRDFKGASRPETRQPCTGFFKSTFQTQQTV